MNKHPFRADLHCHSTASDGSVSPKELILLAKSIGLQGLSICDHDTIEGYLLAKSFAEQEGILLGPGIEFSCEHKGISVHVLGYDFIEDHALFLDFCKKHKVRRKKRNKIIIENLQKLGIPIEESELDPSHTHMIGRPHIAKLLLDKGVVPSFESAFHRYLGEGKPAFARGDAFSLEETLEVIHQAKGKAFLAHPHLHKGKKEVKMILEMPFDGLECYYARFSENEARPYLMLAQEKGLLISGGSDFHGSVKPHSYLGSSFVSEESFRAIFTNLYDH